MARASKSSLPATQSQTNHVRSNFGVAALILIVAVLPYVQTLWHGFVDYDDNQYITQNEMVQRGLSFEGIKWAFTTFAASNWHPLTWLSHMGDVQVWGNWAGGHHLTNVVLHALNSVLLFAALVMMTASRWPSALVAFVFAAHPLHVESVAWIAERKDVLSACFGLLTIIAYVQYVKRRKLRNYVLVLCAFAFSLLSKPMLVTLPFVMLLLDLWPLKRLGVEHEALCVIIAEKIPLFAMAVASSIITVLAQQWGGAMHSLDHLPMFDRVGNASVAYGVYLLKTVWPANLAVIYPLSKPQPLSIAGSILALIVISAIVTLMSRKRPYLITGWLWFLGTLVPVIGLVHVGAQAWADRYMYVPMIGLLMMAAWSVAELRASSSWLARATSIGAVIVTITCLITASIQAAHWKSTITLFSHAVEVTERNAIANNILGNALRADRQFDEAQRHLEAALELNPSYAPAHNNLGQLMSDQGRFAEAQIHYEDSLRFNDRDASIWNNLGVAMFEQGKFQDAEARYRRAIETDPLFVYAYVNLGRALTAQSRNDESIKAYQAAIAIRPNTPEAYANLGAMLWNLRRIEDSIANFETALALNSDMIETRVNLGVALASQGRFEEAIAHFQLALKQNPTRSDIRDYLQMAQQQRDQKPTAP